MISSAALNEVPWTLANKQEKRWCNLERPSTERQLVATKKHKPLVWTAIRAAAPQTSFPSTPFLHYCAFKRSALASCTCAGKSAVAQRARAGHRYFRPFEHSSSGEACFSKLFFEPLDNFRWLDPWCSKKFDNNALFHANQHFLFTHLSCRA